jgi:ParB/RepB/Spo0J family partition protein
MNLENNENCRVELVPARRIKRMPGLQIGASQKGIRKIKEFAKKRGYCKPVVLSDSGGCMTLLAGTAIFEACLEEKAVRIPAVIVQTEGEADNLMFALQSSQLNENLSPIAAGAAIVRLIDSYNATRKHIAETLGKSPAWVNRMENLSRKLSAGVQRLVAEGQISPRSAQEIARLPYDAQMPFAVSAGDEYLSKENVIYLVNRYLNEDTGNEERDRIINTPKRALPNELKSRSRTGKDNSVSARLSRAIARCLDDASYLSNLLDGIDIDEAAVRASDINALTGSLAALHTRLLLVFPRGKNGKGGCIDD